MEAMIDNGEDWMMPMLEFRDFLAATQESRDERALSRTSEAWRLYPREGMGS